MYLRSCREVINADARGIARRLKKYDVRPGDHRFDDMVLKGYRAEDFHDAWQRYLRAVAHVADVAPTAAHRGGNVALDTPAPIGSSTCEALIAEGAYWLADGWDL